MRRTTILNAQETKRTTFQETLTAFLKHCTLKNLRPPTIRYYEENLNFFHGKVPVKYMEDISQQVYDDFI